MKHIFHIRTCSCICVYIYYFGPGEAERSGATHFRLCMWEKHLWIWIFGFGGEYRKAFISEQAFKFQTYIQDRAKGKKNWRYSNTCQLITYNNTITPVCTCSSAPALWHSNTQVCSNVWTHMDLAEVKLIVMIKIARWVVVVTRFKLKIRIFVSNSFISIQPPLFFAPSRYYNKIIRFGGITFSFSPTTQALCASRMVWDYGP